MYLAKIDRWYLERIIWFMAGVVSLAGVTLGIMVNKWWLALNVLVGMNMLILSVTGFCLMAVILKAVGAKPRLCRVSEQV
jgi:hypothetical protein